MATNPFDQFDISTSGNPFNKFDNDGQMTPLTGDPTRYSPELKAQMASTLRPVLEYGGLAAGSMVGGSPMSPTGIAGAGLGYGIGRQGANALDQLLIGKQPQDPLTEISQAGKDVAGGAMMEMGGGILGKAAQGIGKWGRSLPMRLYESAVKPGAPSAQFSRGEQLKVLQAGLDAGISPNQFGIDKLEGLIGDLNSQIMAKIQGGTRGGQTVSRDSILSRLDDTEAFFNQMPNPKSYLNAIDEVRQGMLDTKLANIPLDKAQNMKQTIYKVIKDSYGELSTATKEANKAIARGTKEELVNIFPELQTLNNKESLFLRLEPMIEKASGRINKRDIMGIGTPIASGAAAAIAGPAAGKATLVAKALLENPRAKTYIAILLNKANKGGLGNGIMDTRIAEYFSPARLMTYSLGGAMKDEY